MSETITALKELSDKSMELGKDIGRLQLAKEVHGWVTLHFNELSVSSIRELYRVIGVELPSSIGKKND
jgi:hypothetical protein